MRPPARFLTPWAECAEALVREMSGWEVVTPAQLAVVTFRCQPRGLPEEVVDALNGRLVARMIAGGFAFPSSTVPRGRTVPRMCTINPRTSEADIRETLERLRAFAEEKLPGRGAAGG